MEADLGEEGVDRRLVGQQLAVEQRARPSGAARCRCRRSPRGPWRIAASRDGCNWPRPRRKAVARGGQAANDNMGRNEMKGITGAAGGRRAGACAGAAAPRPTPRPSTGSRTARRPIRSGPTSSPAPSSGPRTPATPSTPRSTTATSPSQQEAVRAAIAAKADGIVTTSPDPGSLVEVAKEANAAKIPIINFNTPDPTASFDAYVGGDNVTFGKHWAQYLVEQGPGEEGRLRLDAGRDPRRHLWRAGGGGHQARVRARRHHLRGHRGDARPGARSSPA